MHIRPIAAFAVIAALSSAAPAFALDMSDATVDYADAPFRTDEAAGISVLTHLGAVEGNPDGTFRPNRTLNRAEFVKIVLLSHPRGADWVAQRRTERGCFPDVRAADWFSPYVCIAKERGILGGYPDGWFRPEQPVNYAEALKILTLLYEYPLPQFFAATEWYEQYVVATNTAGTGLEDGMPPAMLLTRGAMARLAAAFRAKNDDELADYRDAEQGNWMAPNPESSASTSSASSMTSSSSSVASSSASVAQQAQPAFPAVSRFLMLGTRTQALVSGSFTNTTAEDVVVRVPELELRREVRSIEHLYLGDDNAVALTEMVLATANNTGKRFWRAEVTDATPIVIPAGATRSFSIVAQVRPYGDGSPNESFETKYFSITVQGKDSQTSHEILPQNLVTPMHQVTLGRITAIRSLLPAAGTLQPGTNRMIASFAFSGATALPDVGNQLRGLNLAAAAAGIKLERIRVGDGTPFNMADCSTLDVETLIVACDVIPEALRNIPLRFERTLSVYADVSLASGVAAGTLRIGLGEAGRPGVQGGVRWGDGTSEYTWVDIVSPLPSGPQWTVQP